jgi:SAM-dependent methyltransferase
MLAGLFDLLRRKVPAWRTKAKGQHADHEALEGNTFLDAYAQNTDRRVAADPHRAIGGMWQEIGTLQFNYLIQNGMKPKHKLLDIGCGTLRGGRLFIRYLEPAHYTGIDISPKALDYAETLIEAEGLRGKVPRLVLNKNKTLKFGEFAGERFDLILAQSVFTHLLPEHINECFANIPHIMDDCSVFYFTFRDAPEFEQRGDFSFSYPFAFFEELGRSKGLTVTLQSDYPHPRGQRMATARLNG